MRVQCLSTSGKLLCTLDNNKAQCLVRKNLADIVSVDKVLRGCVTAIKLNEFIPINELLNKNCRR